MTNLTFDKAVTIGLILQNQREIHAVTIMRTAL